MGLITENGKIILNKTATEQNEVSSKGLIELNKRLIAERDRVQALIEANIALLHEVLPMEEEMEIAKAAKIEEDRLEAKAKKEEEIDQLMNDATKK